MHSNSYHNTRIICVDDEEAMLETYKNVLSADETDVFAEPDFPNSCATESSFTFVVSSFTGEPSSAIAKTGISANNMIMKEIGIICNL